MTTFESIDATDYYTPNVDYIGLYPNYEGLAISGGCYTLYLYFGMISSMITQG